MRTIFPFLKKKYHFKQRNSKHFVMEMEENLIYGIVAKKKIGKVIFVNLEDRLHRSVYIRKGATHISVYLYTNWMSLNALFRFSFVCFSF